MKLQLALDRLDWETCFALVEDTSDSIDMIEIGTGVIKEYGMEIVRQMRKAFPRHTLLADMKICDAGKHEALQAFAAGADIATVMAFAPAATITETLSVASQEGKEMMVDLLGVGETEQVKALKEQGVSFVGLHLGKDEQQHKQLGQGLFQLVEGIGLKTAIAGGVTVESLPKILPYRPDVLIVGSGITKAEKPKEAAMRIKKRMKASLG